VRWKCVGSKIIYLFIVRSVKGFFLYLFDFASNQDVNCTIEKRIYRTEFNGVYWIG